MLSFAYYWKTLINFMNFPNILLGKVAYVRIVERDVEWTRVLGRH